MNVIQAVHQITVPPSPSRTCTELHLLSFLFYSLKDTMDAIREWLSDCSACVCVKDLRRRQLDQVGLSSGSLDTGKYLVSKKNFLSRNEWFNEKRYILDSTSKRSARLGAHIKSTDRKYSHSAYFLPRLESHVWSGKHVQTLTLSAQLCESPKNTARLIGQRSINGEITSLLILFRLKNMKWFLQSVAWGPRAVGGVA